MKKQLDQSKKIKFSSDYFYILPAVVLVTVFFIFSIFHSLYLSFFSWDGFSKKVFIGFENYVQIFSDKNFWVSVQNTVIWAVVSLLINLFLPLVLALLIINTKCSSLYKNIFYIPSTLSSTVAGVVIMAMVSKYGLPQIFGFIGMDFLVIDWLSVPVVNTFLMIFMGAWRGIGVNLLLFLAGLSSIEKSPIEAAQLDGANFFLLHKKVILPALKPTTVVVLLMSLVNTLKVFDIIWIMTKGGPYRSSETLALTMYTETFVRNSYGTGSAVAIVLTIIILIVAYFNLKNTFQVEKK